ncbi:metallophosphoesterase family protein [soil metagenome]
MLRPELLRLATMRIAIFGDVHGNIAALEAVMQDIETQHPDRVYCLGDLVGYAPFPNEVIERVRDAEIPTVMGNYDDGVGFDRDECGCAYKDPVDRELGQQSLEWTKVHITPRNKAFLQTLQAQIRFNEGEKRILLVHGSPRRMNEYLFEDRPLSSFEHLARTSDAEVIAFGHTHRPYLKAVGGVMFINAGSVGKPKDHDPRACYVMLDTSTAPHRVDFHRIQYDVASTAAAIRASELPDKFALDVELGGAPT